MKKKTQYKIERYIEVHGRTYTWYPAVRSSSYRKFSTKQEKSYYFMHELELKEYGVKLRKARGRSLAHVNDDYPTSVYRYAKSWKHNSRRKHQHFRQEPQ